MKPTMNLQELTVQFLYNCSNVVVIEEAELNFHLIHPRSEILNSMTGRLLDLGAGEGGMDTWRLASN